jgi:hypothetical protein
LRVSSISVSAGRRSTSQEAAASPSYTRDRRRRVRARGLSPGNKTSCVETIKAQSGLTIGGQSTNLDSPGSCLTREQPCFSHESGMLAALMLGSAII